jgi:hypothetical protein
MKITIISALWHYENIEKLIKSIDNQIYQDFQHILINDNNPDVRERFKWLCDGKKRHWVDLGVRTHFYGALARDIGVLIAFSYIHHSKRDIDNEWVCFHDDDNYWEPNHLQTMIDAIESNPEASMVASDAIWVGANDKNFREIHVCKIKHGGCDLGQFLYKTKLFRKHGYFFPHPHRKHKYDIELIQKMVNDVDTKLVFTNKPTFIMNYKKR